MVQSAAWREFAAREGLDLVGMRFVSSDEDLKNGRGYFVASRGSGALLEEGLKKAGLEGLPIYLYGFSGGAHFAMSFAAWRPERVAGFCAYSFAWWSPPPPELRCPALIVCGQADGTRYGSSLAYFQAGRKAGKPWTWVSLKDTPHAPNAELDEFVREYFSFVLKAGKAASGNGRLGESDLGQGLEKQPEAASTLVDNMTERVVSVGEKEAVATSVLPGSDLWLRWRKVHHP